MAGKPNLAFGMSKSGKDRESSPDLDADVADDADSQAADPYTQAAGVIRESIESGDDESIADALRSFVTLCMNKAESEPAGPKGKPKLSMYSGGKG